MKIAKKPHLVEIAWHDAQNHDCGWQTLEAVCEWASKEHWPLAKTVGWLIGKTMHYFVLASCAQNMRDYYCLLQRIPKGCVAKTRRLRRA